jgi:hypothetical protein
VSSSSSTDVAVAGFRLERELGRGTHGVVYEATQLSLDRRVALRLLPGGGSPPALAWPDHPRVVSLYATGPWEGGRFVAMQLVRGPSLAELLEAGELPPARALDLLEDVAAALDAAHAAGITHGDVHAGNVLVNGDGRALLSDFGLAGGEPSVDGDRADFAALVRECAGVGPLRLRGSAADAVRFARAQLPAPAGTRRRGLRVAAGAIALAVAAAAAFVLFAGGSDGQQLPEVEDGAVALGSVLAAGPIDSVDCAGRAPSGASQACTLVQTALPGRPIAPGRAGVVRRWVVRGARGELALQVIRPRGDRYVSVARSRHELVPDDGVHVMSANLPVRPGDWIGVELGPGAAIGVRRDVPGAATARWMGPLFLEARPVEQGPGSGFDHELLLRVDYEPGARVRVPGRLSGRAARLAPDGRTLRARTIEAGGGELRRVKIVEVEDGIAVDLFAGDRRLARLPAPDADPAGRLLTLTPVSTTAILRWGNPDGRTIVHEYTVEPRTLTPRG